MSLFKKWFGKETEQPRVLNHPKDLMPGDLLQFSDSFSLPKQLRGQTFQVAEVNTYQFQREYETEFTLKGDDRELFYMTVSGGVSPVVSISRRIHRGIVEQLFDLDQFAGIFEEHEQTTLPLQQPVDEYSGWLSDIYHQEIFAETGYYVKGDHRTNGVSYDANNEDESFDYYSLISPDEKAAIELEVYDGGETEVCLTIWLAIEDVKDMWPQ